MNRGIFIAATALWVGSMVFIYKNSQGQTSSSKKENKDIENFIEPIFMNKQKLQCDNYPRSNGSIYGEASHLMSGYPYYDKAY